MAHLKKHKLKCPKCCSFNRVYCKGARVKIFDSRIAVEYLFMCEVCGEKKSRTVFSEYNKDIKIHGLSCPFCKNGRKNHTFNVNFKEVSFA